MGRTRRPPKEWNAIEMSRFLNGVLGTTHITPWTLGEIPEHWIDLIVRSKNLEAKMIEQGLIK
jgi:hypothetical protein